MFALIFKGYSRYCFSLGATASEAGEAGEARSLAGEARSLAISV